MDVENTPTGLPLAWHSDGTPIFERSDLIRPERPLPPDAVIYDNIMLAEHRHLRPELKFNLIIIPPSPEEGLVNQAWLGKSMPDERRGYTFGRVIQALDPNCRTILQRWEYPGKITDFLLLAMQPLQLALAPPKYETILFNASTTEPARFFELQAREEVRNTFTIEQLQGAGYLVYTSGQMEANSNYDELPVPTIRPGLDGFRFMMKQPLYSMLTEFPRGFDFIDPPREEFFIGAV